MAEEIKFHDPSTEYASKKGLWIEFYHAAINKSVTFKAWVTAFSDGYESEWTSETVYGRMDPIETFVGTKRTITLGWKTVAASKEEAAKNMSKCSLLLSFLYPVYDSPGTQGMVAPPLLKLKFTNLISDIGHLGVGTTRNPDGSIKFNFPANVSAAKGGLLGRVGGFTFDPDFEEGVFDMGNGVIMPQTVNLNCTFTVFHTHPLGWGRDGKPRHSKGVGFPYGFAGQNGQTATAPGDPNVTQTSDGGGSTPESTKVPKQPLGGDGGVNSPTPGDKDQPTNESIPAGEEEMMTLPQDDQSQTSIGGGTI